MALINTQYDTIMRSYARLQAKARREQEERLNQIYLEIPCLSELESSIHSLQAEKIRARIEGSAHKLADIQEQLRILQERRLALLKEHGYSPWDLEVHYSCPNCQDTGYVGPEKCHCFRQAEIDLLYHQSHLKEVLEQENFNTFSYSWYEEEDLPLIKRNVRDAQLFIENFDNSFQNLLFLGGVGTGKTFLSNCIAKELMAKCHSVVYLTAFQLFELLSSAAFGSDKQSYSYIFECDLLIIDDLGTEMSNSFTVSQFFLCINERILRQKSTLISSNLDIEALRNTYSERTLSRIISSYTIRQFPGKDIRIKKKLRMNT